MIRNKSIYSMIAAATLLAASCTDFDDYSEAYRSGSPESKKTLWENISSRSDLTEFASLLAKGGYDKELGNTRFYTVWAPQNGTFDYATYDQMDSTSLVDRFIKSHVADYNYTISSGIDERVHALNEKSFALQNVQGCTYGNNNIVSLNNPSINGIYHIMDGAVQYLPNIYEYIFDQADTDSCLADYFGKYESETLDLSNSVPGPIDSLGRQTYSDSVMILENSLFKTLDAKINNEDSMYTMLFPTDEAYTSLYDKVKSYFNYAAETKYYPINSDGVGSVQSKTEANKDYDGAYLADSLAKMYIAGSLIFPHSDRYNYWLDEVSGPAPTLLDTLRATTYIKLSDGKDILSHTIGAPEQMSNGYIRRMDSLAFKPWEVWAPELNVNVFNNQIRPLVKEAAVNTVEMTTYDFNNATGDYISRYLDFIPNNDKTARPEVYFYLNGVRSTKYNLYIVFVPSCINVNSVEEEKIIQFDVSLNYMNKDGGIGTASSPTTKFTKLRTDSANLNKIDTFLVGEIDFPYAYVGLTDDCMPYLSVKINRNAYSSTEKNFGNRMRIAGVILRPVEYDEYLKKEDERL